MQKYQAGLFMRAMVFCIVLNMSGPLPNIIMMPGDVVFLPVIQGSEGMLHLGKGQDSQLDVLRINKPQNNYCHEENNVIVYLFWYFTFLQLQ